MTKGYERGGERTDHKPNHCLHLPVDAANVQTTVTFISLKGTPVNKP